MNNELVPTRQPDAVADTDLLAVQIKLWEFLARRVSLYTMGDSSSVRVETAQELLASVCFVMGLDLDRPQTIRKLTDADLDSLFSEGIASIEKKIEIGKRLWNAACLSIPKINNISLRDTLKSIGGFFKRYDYRFFAHDIPCDIDYQLCHPVPDDRLGIDYINDYLQNLLIEQDFLRRFDPAVCIGLLQAYCPDYRGLLINLFEPVATNAVGIALVDGDILKLSVSTSQREQIAGILEPLSHKQAIMALQTAADRVCVLLNIRQPAARRYIRRLAAELYPRIESALSADGLDSIFLTF